jgi:hypothetical protein
MWDPRASVTSGPAAAAYQVRGTINRAARELDGTMNQLRALASFAAQDPEVADHDRWRAFAQQDVDAAEREIRQALTTLLSRLELCRLTR